MYLTYDEYIGFGGTLDDSTFNDLAFGAEVTINYATFNRLVGETVIPKAVKRLMAHLIEMAHKKADAMSLGHGSEDGSGSKYVTSQSNDGVSVSYNGMASTDLYALCEKDVQTSIKTYLYGLKNSKGYNLLYRGLYPGE